MAGRIYETAIKLQAILGPGFRAATGAATGQLDAITKKVEKLKKTEESVSNLAALNKALEESRAKHAAAAGAALKLAKEQLGAGKRTKEEADALKAANAQAKAAERDMLRVEKATKKTAEALKKAGVETHDLAAEQHKLQAELQATESRMEKMKRFGGLRERLFGKASTDKEPLVQKFGGQVRGLAGDVAKVGAVGVAAGFGLLELVKKAAEAGDSIDDTAKRLNIGGEALQSLRLQAKLGGAEVGDMDAAIGKLSVNLGKVASAANKKHGGVGGGGFGPIEGLTQLTGFGGGGGGGEDAAKQDPFRKIGLNVKELVALKPDQQIERIADAIAGLKTHEERAAAAAAIFGKGAVKILPVLEGGGEALRKFREEGVRTGQFMSADAIKAAGDLQDSLDALKSKGVNILANALSGKLLPAVNDAVGKITKWLTDNQDKIKRWADTAATWLTTKAIPAIKEVGRWFADTGTKVVSLIEKAAALAGGFGNLAIAIAALKAAPLVKTSLEIIAVLGKMALAVTGYGDALAVAEARQAALVAGVAGLAAAAVVAERFYNIYRVGQDNIDQLEEAKNVANRRFLQRQAKAAEQPAPEPTSGRRILRAPAVMAQVGDGGMTLAPGAIQVTVQGGDLGNPADRKKHAAELGKQLADELHKHERNRRRVEYREAPSP